ncbi:hypothetical protein GCM10009639_42400 [Kitasatospora putterlickiae]|uniref:DUF397 domain-containing protein n=1 Tax=Kitasatospora putterlickiae TaxID=221725 RepID=A0ABP4IWR4_9ACTN
MTTPHDPYDHDPKAALWAISQYSGDNSGSCVRVAHFDNGDVWLGDDKHLDRPHLAFRPDEWAAFVKSIKNGDPNFPAV